MSADDPDDTAPEPVDADPATDDADPATAAADPTADAPTGTPAAPSSDLSEGPAEDVAAPDAPGTPAPDLSEGPAEDVAAPDAPGTASSDLSEGPAEDVAAPDAPGTPAPDLSAPGEQTDAPADLSLAPAASIDPGDPGDLDDDPGAPEDDLAAALAELEGPRRPAPAGVQLSEELPIDPEDDLRGVEGEASLRLVSILESLLFAAARPLRVQDLRRILAETSKHQIQLALAHLMAVTRERGVVLAQVAGGFQFRTHPDNAAWVQRMLQTKPARLSRTQIETLAIVAYRQPITRPEIDAVRGVDSGAVLKGLLERELVQIVGKKEEPGRPLLYGTTVKFLEFFNLRGLRDLPTLRDFRDLSEESKATLRTQLGATEAEALGQGVLGFPSAAPEGADMPEPEQDPTPMELPGDPSPDEIQPPAPEQLPGQAPDEIRPPDPGVDSPGRPDEIQPPSPDIADIPGTTGPDIGTPDPGPDVGVPDTGPEVGVPGGDPGTGPSEV